ncbi:response regulator [Burkholderia sp. 3C]
MPDREYDDRESKLADLTHEELRARLQEAEEALDAIRSGAVDAVVGEQNHSARLYTLVNADRLYRELIEQMQEGALMLSADGSVLYANRVVAELLGKQHAAIVGHAFARHLDAAALPDYASFLATGSTRPARREFELINDSGTAIAVSISLSPLLVSDLADQIIVCAVITDLREQRQAEAQRRQSQKMEAVGQLTGGLAHDFNNLLQAIHGNLELIQHMAADAEKVQKWAQNAARSVMRGAKLTAQLLAFSRTQQVALSSVVVDDLITGMSEMLTRSLGTGIDITFELHASATPVVADSTQLELALLNLAINARDAMPEGGALVIASRVVEMGGDPELTRGRYVEIGVTDNGHGMPDHVRAKAFEPFFTTKEIGAGTGLGLAQVFGIARQAGGTARIESESGIGTKVTILLRLTEPAVVASSSTREKASAYATEPKYVLVVDDDDAIRTALVDSLEMLGYIVDVAADAPAALQSLDRRQHDIVLLDYAMPRVTGGELAVAMRQRSPRLPIVFITGFADKLDFSAISGPEPAVLLKPFPLEILASTIARMLV